MEPNFMEQNIYPQSAEIVKGNQKNIPLDDIKQLDNGYQHDPLLKDDDEEEPEYEEEPQALNRSKDRKLEVTKLCYKTKIRKCKQAFPDLLKNIPIDDIDNMTLTELKDLYEQMDFIIGMESADVVKNMVVMGSKMVEMLPYMQGFSKNLLGDPIGILKLERLSIHYCDQYYLSPFNDFLAYAAMKAFSTFTINKNIETVNQSNFQKIVDPSIIQKYSHL